MRAGLAVGLGGLFAFGAMALVALPSCGARSSLEDDPADGGSRFLPGIHPDGGTKPGVVDAGAHDAVTTDTLPPPDATPYKVDCTDPSVTYIYVVTITGELLLFDPGQKTFKTIGALSCPSLGNPFSMAVDRKGVAYVLYSYDDGSGNGGQFAGLFKVSTKTGACTPTPFAGGQAGFNLFGMGFATLGAGPDEALYVAATPEDFTTPSVDALALIDTTTFQLHPVGDFSPPITGAELTGTGDGRLFAFTADDSDSDASRIDQLDKTSAKITATVKIPGVPRGNGWAFGFWGGSFWLFTSPLNGGPRVTQYDPTTGAIGLVATLPDQVVGAGVSTCAPEE